LQEKHHSVFKYIDLLHQKEKKIKSTVAYLLLHFKDLAFDEHHSIVDRFVMSVGLVQNLSKKGDQTTPKKPAM
jgi:hypothetical protein